MSAARPGRRGESAHNAHTGTEQLPSEEGDLLTARGHAQARAAGAALAALGLGVTRLLSSPMRRARETAAALEGPLGLSAEPAPRAYEMGAPEESFEDALARVRALKRELEAGPEGELPLLVTHGIFTRFFLLDEMLGTGFDAGLGERIWRLGSANCALTTFARGQSRYPNGEPVPGWTCLSWMERPWDRP
jgi:broad specificity phosphatase PhoE